jgi:hypothetical protein
MGKITPTQGRTTAKQSPPKMPSLDELKAASAGKPQSPNQPIVVDGDDMAEFLRRIKAPSTTGNSGS